MKMPWYSVRFILLFRNTGKKGHLDESDFQTVMVVFPKCHSKSYLIRAMFKVPSQKLWGILTTGLWKTPYSWRFYGQGSRYVLIFWSRIEQTWWNENWLRCTENRKVAQKFDPALQRTLPKNRWHFTYFHTLRFISNKPSF